MSITVKPFTNEKLEKFLSLDNERSRVPQARFGNNGCLLPVRYAESAQMIKHFVVRDDDTWIVTPPKCGTTWTQEMVWLIMHDLDFEGASKTPLFERSPFIELSRYSFKRKEEDRMDTMEAASNLSPPRCIKSHLHKDLLPVQLWTTKAKIVYVARDPKDAAVSFYHHYAMNGFTGDKEFYFQCYYEDLVEHAPIWEHILDFWKMKDNPNILFNTYEEMKADLASVIRRTAEFLGKDLTNEDVARLADHLDFKSMKENPAVNFEFRLAKLREQGVISKDQAFIRKGEVGEGRREMSEEMAAKFDERTRRTFADVEGGGPWPM